MEAKSTPKPDNFNSLIEVIEYFKDEQTAINYLTEKRWGGAIICPHCNNNTIYSFSDNKRFKCAKCRKQFTAKVGTIFEESKVPLCKWFVAVYLIISHKKGISSHQLSRDLKITQKTAWFMLHRIRFALGNGSFEMGGKDEIVDFDETFTGGKNKNRHKDKKVENSQGRSFKDKTPVFGALQEQKKEIVERPHKVIADRIVKEKIVTQNAFVKCVVVSDTSAGSIQPYIEKWVKAGTTVVSDEWWAYSGLSANYNHQIVDHGRKQYVNDAGFTTNAIEGFWTLFKRAYIGIYHWMSRKHIQRYVDESAFRYNYRHMQQGARLQLTIESTEGRLTYKKLIDKKPPKEEPVQE